MTRQQLERVYLLSAVGYGVIDPEDKTAIREILRERDTLEKQVNLLEGRNKLVQLNTVKPLTAERDALRDALHTIQEAFERALHLSGGKRPSFLRISNV